VQLDLGDAGTLARHAEKLHTHDCEIVSCGPGSAYVRDRGRPRGKRLFGFGDRIRR
jgi:hypothetical protein